MIEEYLSWVNYFGVALFVASAVYIWLATRRRNWPSTEGKIERSGATQEVTTTTSLTGSDYQPFRKTTTIDYIPHLEYTYTVKGVTYSAKKLYSVNILPITATDLLPIICGSIRQVYVNPSDPRKSYLLRSPLAFPVTVLVLGALLASLSVEMIEQVGVICNELLGSSVD